MAEQVPEHDFDIAVSFAGEDRDYVVEIVDAVKGGMRVFYDEDYEVEAWGKDGIEYFTDIYQHRARYVVMFVSQHYAKKMWTRTERRAALARAATQRSEYVLPVRLDDTQLEGLLPTTIYLDARRYGVEGLIKAIEQKIGGSKPVRAASSLLDGKVPRSQEAIEAMMTERPDAWEYLLYAGLLNANMEKLEPEYRDFAMGYARRNGVYVPRDDLLEHVQGAIGSIEGIVDNFNAILDAELQERAFGAPGEPGDVDRIVHLAERFVSVYEDLMGWAADLRGASAPGGGAEVLKLLARWAEQPVDECRRFVKTMVAEGDTFTDRLAAGDHIDIQLTVTLELDPALSDAVVERMRKVMVGDDD